MFDLQKGAMWKRISAWLFDAILLVILAVLFGWLLSTALGYDGYNRTLEDAYARYGDMYGVDFSLTLSDYEQLSPEQLALLDQAYAALGADAQAVHAYNMVMHLTLLILTFSILLGYIVMEFTVPMLLGNGQTLGKKIFGLGLMHTDGVQVNGRTMFIRTILGKFTIETMVPVLMVLMIAFGMLGLEGTLVVLGILAIQAVMIVVTRTNALIHDKLADTVVVDVASQMIFKDRAAMIAYKEKLHARKVADSTY